MENIRVSCEVAQPEFFDDEILIADIKKTLGFPQKKCKIALKNIGNELKK